MPNVLAGELLWVKKNQRWLSTAVNHQDNQQKLDIKLVEVLKGLTTERRNLQTVSTGLVNSTSVLLKKQALVIQTED